MEDHLHGVKELSAPYNLLDAAWADGEAAESATITWKPASAA